MINMTLLGDRMKGYEKTFCHSLPNRMPIIIRLDGKAFHTFTRGMRKPFDFHLMEAMNKTAKDLVRQVQGCVLAYVQSDEISLLIRNDFSLEYSPWFANEIQKLVSTTAAMASVSFSMHITSELNDKTRYYQTFDSRAFVLPKEEVTNYFIWRQQDWIRNSVQMYARSLYSQKEMNKKKNEELKEMIKEKTSISWDNLGDGVKFGRVVTIGCGDGSIDDAPLFVQNRDFIENLQKVTYELVE